MEEFRGFKTRPSKSASQVTDADDDDASQVTSSINVVERDANKTSRRLERRLDGKLEVDVDLAVLGDADDVRQFDGEPGNFNKIATHQTVTSLGLEGTAANRRRSGSEGHRFGTRQ